MIGGGKMYGAKAIKQHLFKVGGTLINFNTGVVTDDSGSGVNANLVNSNSIQLSGIDNILLLVDNKEIINLDNDFVILMNISISDNPAPSSGMRFFEFFDNLGNSLLRCNYFENDTARLFINNIKVVEVAYNKGISKTIVAFVKSGDDFTLYDSGLQIFTHNQNVDFDIQDQFNGIVNGPIQPYTMNINQFSVIQNVTLTPAEVAAITTDKDIYDTVISNAVNAYYWAFAEGVNDIVYDICNDEHVTLGLGYTRIVESTEKFSFNLLNGFEKWNDGNDILVPLRYNNTSLGVTPLGASLTFTASQNAGNDFSNCETLLNNTAMSGVNVFWNANKSYIEIQSEPSIDKIQGVNKLNSIITK